MKIFIKKFFENNYTIHFKKQTKFEILLHSLPKFYFSADKNNSGQKKPFFYKPKKKKNIPNQNYEERKNYQSSRKSSSQNSEIDDISTNFLNEMVSLIKIKFH